MWTLLSFLVRDDSMTSAEAWELLVTNAVALGIAALLIVSVVGLARDRAWARRYSVALFGAGALVLARIGLDPTATATVVALTMCGGVACLLQCVLLLAADPPKA